MPTPRKYATNAERQAAYRARGATTPVPPRPLPSALPSARRWTAYFYPHLASGCFPHKILFPKKGKRQHSKKYITDMVMFAVKE